MDNYVSRYNISQNYALGWKYLALAAKMEWK